MPKDHGNRGKGKGYRWLADHVGYAGDDCLLWPMFRDRRDGYGRMGYNGELFLAHRLMCRLVNGLPPTEKHEAAHSCGNGHMGCVNPRHLSWKTRSENELDKHRHGTIGMGRGNRTHLTLEQIADIRKSKGVLTIQELVKKHGIKRSLVQYWQSSNHAPAAPGMSYAAQWKRRRKSSSMAY